MKGVPFCCLVSPVRRRRVSLGVRERRRVVWFVRTAVGSPRWLGVLEIWAPSLEIPVPHLRHAFALGVELLVYFIIIS